MHTLDFTLPHFTSHLKLPTAVNSVFSLFHEIGLQMAEILLLKAVKTQGIGKKAKM